MHPIKTLLLAAVAATALLHALFALAAPPADFDARVQTTIDTYGVPGMAIAIVEDGQIALAKGYGVRKLGGQETVDADTLFVIGSTGKAFTSAALAVLVDEGKIGWDDKVIDRLPDFRMYDPWVTREITIRDLLVHRSGLGLGAGDLLFVPTTSRSRADIVHALRHIEPATSFRSGYAYDNVLYVVAGQVVEAVSGQTWETFTRERVLKPAGMTRSTTDQADLLATANRAQPHARIDGRIRGIGQQEVLDERDALPQVAAPAGGIASSANEMGRWVATQLAHGLAPGEEENRTRVFSEAASREMWTAQTLTPIAAAPAPIAETTPQFSAYALGWTVQDYRGVKLIQHGGAVFGMQSYVVLAPQLGIGLSMQINSEDGGVVMRGLVNELLDHYMDAPPRDWVADFDTVRQSRVDAALTALDVPEAKPRRSKPTLTHQEYTGRYADAWYGPIEITNQGNQLRIDFSQTPGMTGTLEHWQYDTFRTRWDNRTIEPALVTFALDAQGKVDRITLKPASPLADFSYNYADLLFRPLPTGDSATSTD